MRVSDVTTLRHVTRRVHVTRYLCVSCGFSEEWIDVAEDVAKLKAAFGPASRQS